MEDYLFWKIEKVEHIKVFIAKKGYNYLCSIEYEEYKKDILLDNTSVNKIIKACIFSNIGNLEEIYEILRNNDMRHTKILANTFYTPTEKALEKAVLINENMLLIDNNLKSYLIVEYKKLQKLLKGSIFTIWLIYYLENSIISLLPNEMIDYTIYFTL